jgi:hypothetical protein
MLVDIILEQHFSFFFLDKDNVYIKNT